MSSSAEAARTSEPKAARPGLGELVTLAALIAAGAVLRNDYIATTWLNPDEGLFYQISKMQTVKGLFQFASRATHPPLYPGLLWLMCRVDDDFVWLRCLSLLLGLVSIVLAYLLGRSLAGRGGALALAAFVALSPASIGMAQILKPYTLLISGMLTAVLGLSLVERGRSGGWRIYTLGMSAAVLSHYSAVFSLLPLLAAQVASAWRRGPDRAAALRTVQSANMPVAFAVLAALALNFQFWFNMPGLRALREGVFYDFYIYELPDVIRSCVGALVFLAGDLAWAPVAACMIAASVLSAIRREWLDWWLTCGFFLTAIMLSATGVYMFGGARHSYYLLVPVLWSIAYVLRRLADERGALRLLAGLLLTAGALELSGVKEAFPRSRLVPSPIAEEFPIDRADMDALVALLDSDPGAAPVLAIDQHSFYTLRPLLDTAVPRERSNRYTWKGRLLMVSDLWQIAGEGQFLEADGRLREELASISPPEPSEPCHIMLGWGYENLSGSLDRLAKSGKIVDLFRRPGVRLACPS